uniref:Uncharacterized protein n=1 Tax=Megaselia scalaris TaxID=36166 RepID=T1GUY2_MEGSC
MNDRVFQGGGKETKTKQAEIINNCISKATFPECLKSALVNYRPISLLPVLGKLFEKKINA